MLKLSAVELNVHLSSPSYPFLLSGVNNFTQLIWKSTSEIGVGVSKLRDSDKYVVVTQYRPPGNNNMPGEFKKNVLPPHEASQQHVCN